MTALTETNIEAYPLFSTGKIREMYDLKDKLLIVTTDRISAFDHVLPTGIEGKGKVLNKLSVFWFNFTKDIVNNHFITDKIDQYPSDLQKYKDQLEGRSMMVKKAERIDIECVVRGYLAGSGWRDYQKNGSVCGIELPDNLKQSDKLPQPIFTPATKAETGHDENISFQTMKEVIGSETAEQLKKYSIDIYTKCADYALKKGIIIADTKFEFGKLNDEIILIDEILTPDSSRFWDKSIYEPGKSQDSFDKQIVRNYLEETDWDKESTPPSLPDDIVNKTIQRYKEVADWLIE